MEHLDEFDILSGFKFIEAYEQTANCSNGTKEYVTTLRFANDKNVGVDIDVVGGELHLSEPYAVNEDYEPINGGA